MQRINKKGSCLCYSAIIQIKFLSFSFAFSDSRLSTDFFTYRYRFIFLSFFEILKDIPELEEEYSKLFSVRKKEFQTVFVDTSEKSIFLNNIPELILDNLIHQLFINIENWINYNEITMKLNGEEAVRFYSVIFLSMLYPFFTAKTQQDFIQKFS